MKSRMPDDYKIPDDPDTGRMDAAYIRSCLGLRAKPDEEPPELPVEVRRAHYDMARSLSILGATGPRGMTPTQIATVVALSLRDGVRAEDEEEMYAFPAGDAQPGQKVVVHWRKKDRPAHFLEARNNRILVLHDGNEVKMRPDLVRFPEEGEFPEVADNINTVEV
jgi:hypothetical protein